MTTVYGITHCETVKKARVWLEKRGVDYRFHDFRKDGLDQTLLKTFIKNLGWEALLNKSGMTWRKLPEKDKAKLDEKKAASLMLAHPTVIKRPVLTVGEKTIKYHVGFNEKDYETLFTKKK